MRRYYFIYQKYHPGRGHEVDCMCSCSSDGAYYLNWYYYWFLII